MEYACLIGESDMQDFTTWWGNHQFAWIIIHCLEGEAEMTLQLKRHCFKHGMTAFIAPYMYPSIVPSIKGFKAFYCLMSMEFADKSLHDIPNSFFYDIYAEPILYDATSINAWMHIMVDMYKNPDNTYRQSILSDILHAFTLDYYSNWQVQYGNRSSNNQRSSAEIICMKFYDLITRHFKEHRNTAFYADKLCITPCYLAMVTRQVYQETPKQAIDRQVTLEIKYLLRNTDMTAEQIAIYLHFPDTSYMCRFFRRHTGQTISEYRKNGSEQS